MLYGALKYAVLNYRRAYPRVVKKYLGIARVDPCNYAIRVHCTFVKAEKNVTFCTYFVPVFGQNG